MQVPRNRLAPSSHINAIVCGEKPSFLDGFLVGPFCGAMKVFEVLGAISISNERHKPVGEPCGKEASDDGHAETNPKVFPDLFRDLRTGSETNPELQSPKRRKDPHTAINEE